MTGNGATTSGELRAHNRVRLLRAVHDSGAARTRSQLTRELELARGTASVLVGGLAADGLLHEQPAAEHARGRPTMVPGPHPRGPVALAADVREDAWELTACELGGRVTVLAVRPHDGTPEGTFLPLGAELALHAARYAGRVVGTGVAVAGPVRPDGRVDIAHLRWRSVDVPALLARGAASPDRNLLAPESPADTPAPASPSGPGDPDGIHPTSGEPRHGHPAPGEPGDPRRGQPRPVSPEVFGMCGVRVGNDTALAGLAEARRGRLRGVEVGLHLHVDFDLGGVLIVGGRPLGGASGSGAEFGHMPLSGGTAPCMCGALGCWSLDVGANALLRHMGREYGGGRGRGQAEEILARAAAGDAAAEAAVLAGVRALGRGIAALVNAHDPEVVTLSGLGADLLDRAGKELWAACEPGLMTIRGERPPLIVPGALRWRGSLLGAMESVFDAFLTPDGLATWRDTPGNVV